MAEPKSHRERAERAAEMSAVLDYKRRLRVQSVGAADIIARETFPAELIEAVKEVLAEAEAAGWSGALCNLEDALALYSKPTTIYLDPSRWLRGLGEEKSRLWDDDRQKGCCIGLALLQLGIEKDRIGNERTIRGVFEYYNRREVPDPLLWMYQSICETNKIYDTNDRIGIPPAERVEKINALTEPHGLRFVLQETL